MPFGRNLITTMSLAAAIVLLGARAPGAQEQPPDPRMLLNLDLFASPSGGNPAGPAAPGGAGSMLDQIRTLTAMGYLGGHGQGGPWPVEAGGPPPPQMARPILPPYGSPLPDTSVIPPADTARHTPSESQDENEE